ncbi:MAG: anti-sigma factor antagonist [candidate division Zixibacteria bacterium]|nr:anti-sigma factor antagonist [candidate division Zixibacteria bacterium]
MKITSEEKYGAVVISIDGNIMGGPDEAQFYEKLQELIKENKKNVVVDLGDVEWINSRGLGMLISGLTTMKNAGGKMKLARVANKVESLLAMTKLISVFENHDTVDEAVKSFG